MIAQQIVTMCTVATAYFLAPLILSLTLGLVLTNAMLAGMIGAWAEGHLCGWFALLPTCLPHG